MSGQPGRPTASAGYPRLSSWKKGSTWFSTSSQPGTASAGYTRLSSWKKGSTWFSTSSQPGTASAGYTRLSSSSWKEGSNWFSMSGQPGTSGGASQGKTNCYCAVLGVLLFVLFFPH